MRTGQSVDFIEFIFRLTPEGKLTGNIITDGFNFVPHLRVKTRRLMRGIKVVAGLFAIFTENDKIHLPRQNRQLRPCTFRRIMAIRKGHRDSGFLPDRQGFIAD